MASRKTRSAAKRPADGDSSNVTDYVGPSKRQKFAAETRSQIRTEQDSPLRVTRNRTIPKQVSEPKPAGNRRYVRYSPEREEDEEDEDPVNVNFSTVVSASNEARRSRPRTVNGVRIAKAPAAPDEIVSAGEYEGEGPDEDDHDEENHEGENREEEDHDGEEVEDEAQREEDDGDDDLGEEDYGEEGHGKEGQDEDDSDGHITNSHTAIHPLRRRSRLSFNATQKNGSNQHKDQQSQERSNDDIFHRDLYEFEASPQPTAQHSSPKAIPGSRANAKMPEASRRTSRQQMNSSIRRLLAQQDHEDDGRSDVNDDDGEGVLMNIGEDSAFIQAPRTDEDLATVGVIINSLGGIIGTLAHAAWTGNGNWNATFDQARGGIRDDIGGCHTILGKSLTKQAKDLRSILESAVAAATDRQKGDGDYEETIDYLREHSDQIGSHLAGIETLIGRICTEGLASSSDLAGRAIKIRRQMLRDIARRLIPTMILIIQTTCSLGPSEERRGKLHLQLSSFTLQFFLRSVSWARRLARALTRGLEQWPFDPEFRQDEDQLDGDQIKSKAAKQRSRSVFEKQLSALHYKAKEAERAMQSQALEAAREELQQRHKQLQMIRAKAQHAAIKREEEEESRRKADRWEAFCRSTQALRYAQDPMKEKWDAAQRAHSQLRSTNNSDQNDAYQSGSTQCHTAPDNSHPRTQDSGICRAPAEEEAVHEPWGLDWLPAEEKIVLRAIRYERNYDPVLIAAELGREEYDVARKAVAIKGAYRSLYRERGQMIPHWTI